MEILLKFRQQQINFSEHLNILEDNVVVDVAATRTEASTTKFSVDEHFKIELREDDVCVVCHGRDSNDSNVLGMIGLAQLTSNPYVEKQEREEYKYLQNRGRLARLLKENKKARGQHLSSKDNQPEDERKDEELSSGLSQQSSQHSYIWLRETILKYGAEKMSSMHVSFCGHLLHSACFGPYLQSNALGGRDYVTELNRGEFSCPLCRRLGNTFVPLVARQAGPSSPAEAPADFENWKLHMQSIFKGISSTEPSPGLQTRLIYNQIVQTGSLKWMPDAIITTIACLEQASRLGFDVPTGKNVLRKSMALFIVSLRFHIAERNERPEGVHLVWENAVKGECKDPMAPLVYMLLFYPGELFLEDVRFFIRLCHQTFLRNVRQNEELLFLRRAAILFSFLSEDAPSLQKYEIEHSDAKSELRDLQHFFELESPNVAESVFISPLRLVKLPKLLQDILEKVERVFCPACHRSVFDPRICLICGELIYSRRKICCHANPLGPPREDEVVLHMMSCTSTIGLFLLLGLERGLSAVRVVRRSRRSTWGSPYLDDHGEEDVGLFRGKPLYLSEERYRALERLWLVHGFEYDATIQSRTTVFEELIG
eukprot:Plantae.Rhodophyta-Purpureofilum_apyrenoidigerum.ctg2439.p1 GENE.Plantae.Rhodophyta-Purpureofilum_apyrenoidigerum.ctg2439~~Plantae.Rhodophyta-Purpureofilum_apyrenoidigerum.ctg2439.p1  ORF type:complete len:598 (+),score=84.59 Plantae.Rhodophyta-Purpureofilum_apyrenoidigerum.ctg2439:532-2325(+)